MMNQETVFSENQNDQLFYHRPAIKRLRIILMFFMCIDLLGFPTVIGGLVQNICGFVPLAFFIISGYLVLREDTDRSARIKRSIKRTAIVFGVLLVVYFSMNLVYYWLQGVNIFTAFTSKRIWFNFIVLNVWPFDIGSAIWYVQALLYAYIIIYFLDKWKLLKYDWIIALVLIGFTILTGELSGILKWNILGYTYLPGNFLTRAIPYILLGAFIHRKIQTLVKVWRLWYLSGVFLGVILTAAEILLFSYFGIPGYFGHLMGMGVTAVSVCMLAFQDDFPEPGFEAILGMSRWHVNCIYYLCQPVSVGVALLLSLLGQQVFAKGVGFIGMITFVVCFFLSWLISRITLLFLVIKEHGKTN